MKRTIITTLKFFDSCLEIEAVEYTSKGIFPIFLIVLIVKIALILNKKVLLEIQK